MMPAHTTPTAASTRQQGWQLMGRVRDVAALWSGFGVLIGVWTISHRGGIVDLAAGAVAGAIVLTPLGAVLGLLGGRRDETLVGGLAGLGLGALAALATGQDPASLGSLGLLMGGLAGATFAGLFWRLPRWLLR
jgi:hypothetical protein